MSRGPDLELFDTFLQIGTRPSLSLSLPLPLFVSDRSLTTSHVALSKHNGVKFFARKRSEKNVDFYYAVSVLRCQMCSATLLPEETIRETEREEGRKKDCVRLPRRLDARCSRLFSSFFFFFFLSLPSLLLFLRAVKLRRKKPKLTSDAAGTDFPGRIGGGEALARPAGGFRNFTSDR